MLLRFLFLFFIFNLNILISNGDYYALVKSTMMSLLEFKPLYFMCILFYLLMTYC